MLGMDRHNGRSLHGDAHLVQSIYDILTTPKGSLLMTRDYGSDLPDIIDNPINPLTLIDVYQATAEALVKWEQRIKLKRVQLQEASEKGKMELSLQVEREGEAQELLVTLPGWFKGDMQ